MNKLLFIGGLGMSEVLVIALIVLLFFGGKKIPELMKGLGKGVLFQGRHERYLGTYQVAGDVVNMLSLQSYMGTLIMMNLTMGIVFEMPVLCWLFGKFGFCRFL